MDLETDLARALATIAASAVAPKAFALSLLRYRNMTK